jgi:hypothetical protein
MEKALEKKAKNYFILGLYAEEKGMHAEAVTNYFKALFALADIILFRKIEKTATNHTKRFELLKEYDQHMYNVLDSLFFIYRETYTKEISLKRVKYVREKVHEGFTYSKIKEPTKKDL